MSAADALKSSLASMQITSAALSSLSSAKYNIRKFQCVMRLGFLTCPVWELKARWVFVCMLIDLFTPVKAALISHYKMIVDFFFFFCDNSGALSSYPFNCRNRLSWSDYLAKQVSVHFKEENCCRFH